MDPGGEQTVPEQGKGRHLVSAKLPGSPELMDMQSVMGRYLNLHLNLSAKHYSVSSLVLFR